MRGTVPIVLLVVLATSCSDTADVGTSTTQATSSPTTAASPTPPVSSPATTPPTTGADGTETDSSQATDEPVVPVGFERVRASVTEPDGTVCDLCLWRADTAELRGRGLMRVTDLGDADGMAFVYPGLHTGTFWMKDTVLPLSIAFFGPTGAYLDAFDMEPCTSEPCGQYPTPNDFVVAIETTQGDLPELGIVPGSVLDLTDVPCEAG